ncbi:hypothetical protein TRFO_27410 [Tritrichomonas foetus]|uniref:EamA domain-containing protein n=1 Tax=Tritrichomonas foetus TaxID=1144522 RepID=A0A1J4K0R7_9EUKA|nr:hypothetical protein TRFO_27410 [Tritrichomonas foetus]|eukprot:OHT04967.1 hypothetical protein TRFO_27410 [Tritrichomonas foetus]
MGVLGELLLAGAMLSTGSLNTVSKKIMYQTNGTTIDGIPPEEPYQKPWLCTFVMFCGESMCMVFFYLFALYYKCKKMSRAKADQDFSRSQTQSIASEINDENLAKNPNEKKIVFVSQEETEGDPTGGLKWRFPFYAALFASCDLLSTSLTGIGLTLVAASVVQILRGFVIVITMFFAWIFLKRKPKVTQVLGVIFAVLGLGMVGTSAVLGDKSEQHPIHDTLKGIGLTILSQVFSAFQFVFEEKLLKQNDQKVGPIPSLFLVGSEGIAGAILSISVALPIANFIKGSDHGSYENMKNSFYMMFHNKLIFCLQFLYFISIAFFNWCSFVYSKTLSATARTLVDACRTIVVWIVMASVYQIFTNEPPLPYHQYGEPVTYWSILQCGGFILMMFGTITHNNIGGLGDKITSCCRKKNDIVDAAPLLKNEGEANQ